MKKHILIINRFDDELSNYREYINHDDMDVSYISLVGKSKYIDPSASKSVVELEALNVDQVREAARGIHVRQAIDSIIAFSEYDLDAAAHIRSDLNISGAKVEDNLLCRNKVSMKSALEGGGMIRYPAYQSVSSRQDVVNFCLASRSTCILKPQVGAASSRVVKIGSVSDIPNLEDFTGYEIEEYIEGDIYHVDAILAADSMPYFKVSKYINTCLDFRNGLPLGSVTVDCADLQAKVKDLTDEVCLHLHLKDQAIHLELIKTEEELVFLEVGARVGGGEIPFVAARNEGIDLYKMWAQASLGSLVPKVNTRITGFLMMPNPFSSGFEFDFANGLDHQLITFKDIRSTGSNSDFSYEDIPAKLHFMGDNQLEVETAIVNCMEKLQKSIRPLRLFSASLP